MASRRRGDRGFTLVEMMVTVTILAVVFAVVYQLFVKTQKSFYNERALLEAQGNARLALEAVSADIRHASYGKDATQASVTFAGPESIAFTADLYDSIPGAETITLFLSADYDSGTVNPTDRLLEKRVFDVNGILVLSAPLSYGIADNGLGFNYYDVDGDSLVFPITNPEAISEVEVSVTSETPIEVEGAGYLPVTFTTTVFPRNLPFTASKAKPTAPNIIGLASPNCESITVTWVTPTNYTDGSTLKFKDISHFNIYYGESWADLRHDTRVARIVNEWTVGNLDATKTYMMVVTCVATNGVESDMSVDTGTPGGASVPAVPANVVASTVGSAVTLRWDRVTTDVGGGTLTVSVGYNIYRSASPNASPIDANRIGTEITDTTFVDVLLASCGTFYYRVTATACGGESDPTADIAASNPAAASCAQSVWATDGPGFGEVTVTWSPPSTRSDGTSLAVTDISGYYVVYGTTSGDLTDTLWVSGGGVSSGVLVSLTTCTTYFVNVVAVDDCGIKGNVCVENQRVAWTTTPCDVAVPLTPSGLAVTPGDTRLDLVWGTSKDCDIAGYVIYYDKTPGPPYNGVGANEGDSPIVVDFAAAIVDSSISMTSLTGLDPCETYFVAISAIDQCSPPNESGLSAGVSGEPNCIPCNISNACIAEYAAGAGNVQAHGDIVNDDGSNIDVETMSLSWNSGQRLIRLYAGGTLVWAADGTAGGDGVISPAPLSPLEIDCNNWTLPASASDVLPLHIRIDFDGSVINDCIVVDLEASGSQCGLTFRPTAIVYADDFQDDPNGGIPSNWTNLGGSWSISTNRLKSTGTTQAIARPSSFASVGNYTMEATVNMSGTNSTRRGGLHVRFVDTNNYYLFRVYPGLGEATFTKRVGATTTDIAWTNGLTLFDGLNHTLKVTANGNDFRCWVDGNPVTWISGGSGTLVTDGSISSGGIAVHSRNTSASYFDNILVYRTCGGCP